MAQTTAYTLSIDDTSPQVIYTPSTFTDFVPTPDLSNGWHLQYNGSGFATFPGELGLGESTHVTTKDGANLSMAFTGTGINLYGLALRSTFSISLDNDDLTTPSDNISTLNDTFDESSSSQLLTSVSGLPEGNHILTLTTHIISQADDTTPSLFLFDRAVIAASTGLANASVSTQTIDDTEMQFTGLWAFMTDPTVIPDGDNSFRISQLAGDFAEYTFQGSSIVLSGLVNATAGLFNVSLTTNSSPPVVDQQQLSGISPFLAYTTLFSASGLDPNSTHTLTITNLENKSLALDGMNVTVVSGGNVVSSLPPSPSATSTVSNSKHRLSQDAIAGIGVGVAVGVVLILTALVFLYNRRRRRRWWNEQSYGSGFSADGSLQRPRHKRIRSASLMNAFSPRPGQGLVAPSPMALAYDYRSVAHDDTMIEIGRGGDEGDSDLGHGPGQKKFASIYSNVRSPLPELTRVAGDANNGGGRGDRQSGQSVTRWSTIFGSPTRTSFRRSQMTVPTGAATGGVAEVPIVAPKPQRIMPPVSVLTREQLKDPQSRRSSSVHSGASDEDGFLHLPRSSPFAVEFGRPDAERQSEGRSVVRHGSTSVAEASIGHSASNVLVSFLDFASSAASSLRGSSRSRSRRRPSSSNKSGQSKGTQRSRRTQNSSTGTSSTGMWTLTLSLDRNGSTQGSPRSRLAVDTNSPHPFSAGAQSIQQQESPTDSVPMSVSDINFRPGDEEDETLSAGRGALPRHPPLPATPLSFSFGGDISTPLGSQFSNNSRSSDQRRPYVAQTVFGRRLAEARAQGQGSSTSLPASRSNSTLPFNRKPSNPSMSEQQRSGSRSRNTSFMNFGRGGGS